MEKNIKEFKERGLSDTDMRTICDFVNGNTARFRRLAQRRLFGEPFAYLFNESIFLGNKFFIDKRVYVPNPETEEMVEVLLEKAKDGNTIIDVGCGSGAIGISLKLKNNSLKVYGLDIDPSALEVAHINNKKFKTDVSFQESFYVDDLNILAPDFIISDLPYGDQSYTLPSINIREFSHMPPIALFHPKGPLEAYRELIQSILIKGWKTKLIFESGRVEKEEVAKIIPFGMTWDYLQCSENYSVTIVRF